MTKHIPNLVTLLNLFCGVTATLFVVQGHLIWGVAFVIAGIIFDFMDGALARLLKAQSPLGLQLDSLADVVTSGVVPGLVMYQLLAMAINVPADMFDTSLWSSGSNSWSWQQLLPFMGLLIPMASAYRLAKFNLDTEQQNYFKGLPTPANTLFIIALPLIMEYQNNDLINAQILNPITLVIITLASVYMLNAPIKLFSLKFKSVDFKSNATRYIFLILSFIMLIVLQYAAIPALIILYIIMSVLDGIASK